MSQPPSRKPRASRRQRTLDGLDRKIETVAYTTRHMPTALLDRLRVLSQVPPKRTIERVLIDALARALPTLEAEAAERYAKLKRKKIGGKEGRV